MADYYKKVTWTLVQVVWKAASQKGCGIESSGARKSWRSLCKRWLGLACLSGPLGIQSGLNKEFAFYALVTSPSLKQKLSLKELAEKWMTFPVKTCVRLSSAPFSDAINPFFVSSWLWTIDLELKDFMFHCQAPETSRHPSCLLRPCALPFLIAKITICSLSCLFPYPGLFPSGN